MTPATVPMISPDGKSGDIPQNRAQDAMAAGFKPAVVMTSPDGKSTGYIPRDRAADAVKEGFTVGQATPEKEKQGFLGAVGEDAKALVTSLPQTVAQATPAGQLYLNSKKAMEDYKSVQETGKTLQERDDDARKAAGYGAGYRAIAPIGEAVGVNAKGMEQAAASGDPGAVMGHAAAAAAPAVVAPLVAKGITAAAPGIRAASSAAVDATKSVASSPVGRVLTKLAPDAIGTAVPQLAHAMKLFDTLYDALKPAAKAADAPAPAVEAPQPRGDFTFQYRNLPPEVKAKAQTILDAAQEQAKQVVADAQKESPAPAQQAAPTAKASRTADLKDDQAVSQEMNWDMEKQGYRALSEERQRYFADNAPALTKNQIIAQTKVQTILENAESQARQVLEQARIAAEVPAKYTKTKGAASGSAKSAGVKADAQSFDDMSEILQRSIDAVKAKKGK